MPQRLILRAVELPVTLGYLPEEKDEQTLFATLELSLDEYRIAQTDVLEDGLDYTKVIDEMRSFGKNFTGRSLEKFTADLADHLQTCYKTSALLLQVSKPRYASALRVGEIIIEEKRP